MFEDDYVIKNENDLKENIQETQQYREMYCSSFLKGYRDRVNKFYSKEYSENPETFTFMHPLAITFLYTNNSIYKIVCKSTANKDEYNYSSIFLDENTIKNLNTLPDYLRNNKVIELANINQDNFINIKVEPLTSILYQPTSIKHGKTKAYDNGVNKADTNYNLNNLAIAFNEKINGYKDVSKFNILDLNTIFSKITDSEFKYELEESVKAYQAELYLASATTAEIAIETLLRIIIIKKLGKKKLPKQSYILESAKLLRNNSIVDIRLFNRVEAVNNLRHGIAHSATGEIEKWDCEQIFALIKILVDTFF